MMPIDFRVKGQGHRTLMIEVGFWTIFEPVFGLFEIQSYFPFVQEFAKEYSNVIFLKVDVDEASEIAEAEGISAMPTFKLYKDGNKKLEMVGTSEQKLKEMVENAKEKRWS
ncbi:hypothetical protein FSP39_013585 [Pinctada imbricata]|uniref:Thioredoxin domain-containing protein n=1 Tax=Pinctada imbricata TaxID=66713 RepID=A0AA89BQV3_PINIB|nr:hypothetical protein FSP39_013585 [Pinctada imbricata]